MWRADGFVEEKKIDFHCLSCFDHPGHFLSIKWENVKASHLFKVFQHVQSSHPQEEFHDYEEVVQEHSIAFLKEETC